MEIEKVKDVVSEVIIRVQIVNVQIKKNCKRKLKDKTLLKEKKNFKVQN